MSSMYSGNLKLSIFGQSHSDGVGVVVDGLPAGERIDFDALQVFLNRRAPGRNAWSSPRCEADVPEFLSGLVENVTCGAPLCAVIRNTNAHPADYEALRDIPRPGHADYPASVRFGGAQDVAGGGHFSGRLTAPLCVAGGICLQILQRRGIRVGAHLLRVGTVEDAPFDPVNLSEDMLLAAAGRDFPVLTVEAGEAMRREIEAARAQQDSVGGVVECAVIGVPAGLGDPMLDGMENRIARLAFAVPAVKGVEFGDGFAAAQLRGSENNDAYFMDNNCVRARTNHAGGILGGLTTGMPILFRAAIKPTPSIARQQDSVSLSRRENAKLSVQGRHDPCIAPRAVVCMEAVLAIAILDAMPEVGSWN